MHVSLRTFWPALRRLTFVFGFCPLGIFAQTTFEFIDNVTLDGMAGDDLPASMVSGDITLQALSIEGPTSFSDFTTETEAAKATNTTFSGLGIDSHSITNSALNDLYGDDAASETNSMNILEAITFAFDHSLHIQELRFRDLENHEKVTVTVETGEQVVLEGDAAWSAGAGSFVSFSGSQLGELENLLIQRETTVTLQFDTIDPLDRIPDGNGNNLNASPSCTWNSITVDTPNNFGLGAPYVVAGGANEATVGGELWGESASVTLWWTTDPDSEWTNSRELGSESPVLFEALMDGVSPDTVWYYKFTADNGTETVESPVSRYIWATTLYVSPEGDDASNGLSQGTALKTIEEALERIRGMRRRAQPEGPEMPNYLVSATSTYGDDLESHLSNLVDPVTVVLLPGWHFLEETIQIDKSVDGNIHFVGQWNPGLTSELESALNTHGQDPGWFDLPSNQMPIISGGAVISDWTTTSVNGREAWVADLPDVATGKWDFRQLFVDGVRAQRSRWPKEGWFRMADVDNETRLDFQVDQTDLAGIDIAAWTNLHNVETVMLHRWVEDRNTINSYDPETDWISLNPPRPDFDLYGSHPVHEAGFAAYYFDNVLETMSEPGEFYLNQETGELYYIPLPGQTPETTEVIAPRLRELAYIYGKPARDGAYLQNIRLWNVTFRNIAFMHTLSGMREDHVGTGNSAANSANGAIRYQFARKGSIEGCLFGHLGEYAIELGHESTGFLIQSNLFRSMAAGALKSWQAVSPQNFENRSGFHIISDNDILGFSLLWHGSPAILCPQNIFLEIDYNYIRNGTFNGINVSGVESDLLRFGHSNRIRKNRIHDIGLGWLSDIAGIYAPGQNPHGVIEGNVVHDIVVRDYTSPAIYLDGTAEYWTVRENWLHGSNTKIMNMKGWTHSVHDNVFAYAANKLVDRRDGDKASSQSAEFPLLDRGAPEFRNNIYIPLGGVVYSNEKYTDPISPWAVSDENVFWNHGLVPWAFQPDLTLSEFQASMSQDANSILMDPQFLDPQRGDFRMDPVPAELGALGITSYDNRDAGVRSVEWTASGMPSFSRLPALPEGWMPSDVPGLVGWLDAAMLPPGPLAEWTNTMPFSYTQQQFDGALQPVVVSSYINGNSAVSFDGNSWMGNDEYGLEARQSIGQFNDRDFAIFAVYRTYGDDTVLLSKGAGGNNGNWSIGETPNAFQWDGTRTIGDDYSGWAVRSWMRNDGLMEFYRNGIKLSELSASGYDFNTTDHVYLGKPEDSLTGMLNGEVGEILVYLGSPSPEDFANIQAYLLEKWTISDALFPEPTVMESDAAYGVGYDRDLSMHLVPEASGPALTFLKVSGPDWLTVSDDGKLHGTPSIADSGVNSFEIQVSTSNGTIDVVAVEIEVREPDTSPPEIPQGLQIEIVDGNVHLSWEDNVESDFSHYIIHRTSDLGSGFFEYANPVRESGFSETLGTDKRVFYVIEAVDTSGNHSGEG